MSALIGSPVQFELDPTDATTAQPILIRSAGNGAGTYTLAADERLILQTVNILVAAGVGRVTIFDDVNGDGNVANGERLLVVGEGYSAVIFRGTDGGTAAGKGRVPKMKAENAGNIDMVGVGAIVKG